jgi:hypothetical protein
VIRPVAIALLLAAAGALHATMAVKLDVATLTDKSDLIVIAKVGESQAKWDAGNKGIWTHYDIDVSETLKGEHKAEREFVTRGGVVGNRGQHVAGSGSFAKDDQYVFFFWKDDDGRYQLTGMVQGAFAIAEENGVKRAKNSFTGLTLVDPKTLQPALDKSVHDYALADLKKTVQDRVKAAAKPDGEGK